MKVIAKFPQNMSVLTKTDQIVVELDGNARLSDLLKVLATRYGGALMELLYAPEVSLTDIWPSVIVDGQVVSLPLVPKSNLELREGSEIVLMVPASGG